MILDLLPPEPSNKKRRFANAISHSDPLVLKPESLVCPVITREDTAPNLNPDSESTADM